MPNKQMERFYLKKLCEALDKTNAGFPVRTPEPPDFVIDLPDHRLGIEFTEFCLPPPPGRWSHQEQQSLKDQIVSRADEIHRASGGPALYVTVFFHESPPLSRKDKQPLANAIADAVLNYTVPSSCSEPGTEVPWTHRPKRVSGILVHGSVDGVDRLWNADAGGWVAEITSEHISKEVRRKASREPLARTRCDKLWLVLVNDVFSIMAPSEISDAALHTAYRTPFDRLFWLLPHGPRAIELERRHPAA